MCENEVQCLEKKPKKLLKETLEGFKQKAQAGGLQTFHSFWKGTLAKVRETVEDKIYS
jgi:hypothetical protein